MMVFRTSQVIDENPLLLLARAKVPTNDHCIRALAYRLAVVVHAEHPAPKKSIDYEQVGPFPPADWRDGFLPKQLAVRRIIGGDELSTLHDDNIVDGKQRLRCGTLRLNFPKLPAGFQIQCDEVFGAQIDNASVVNRQCQRPYRVDLLVPEHL